MKNSILWNQTGCLSRDAIVAWHTKTLSHADKYLIEKHLQDCSLCKDVLEGYSLLSADKLHESFSAIDQLYNKPTNEQKGKSVSRRLKLTLAAAIFISFIGIFTFFQFYEVKKTESLAQELNNTTVLAPASDKPLSETSNVPQNYPKVEKDFKPSVMEKEQSLVLADKAAEDPRAVVLEQKEDVLISEEPMATAGEMDAAGVTPQEVEVIGYGTQAKKRVSAAREAAYSAKSISVAKSNESETTFYVVDQPATFKGGDISKFRGYVEEKISSSRDNSISAGELTVTFTVDFNGNVKDAFIVKGLNSKTDSLVLNIVKNSPVWKPAKNGGKPVNVNMVLPLKISKE